MSAHEACPLVTARDQGRLPSASSEQEARKPHFLALLWQDLDAKSSAAHGPAFPTWPSVTPGPSHRQLRMLHTFLSLHRGRKTSDPTSLPSFEVLSRFRWALPVHSCLASEATAESITTSLV